MKFKNVRKQRRFLGDLMQGCLDTVFGEGCAFTVAFTTSKDQQEVHWISNVSREDGINLLQSTADKMKKGLN